MFYKLTIIPLLQKLFCLVCAVLFSSCASSPMVQPQINSLVVAEKFDYALTLLEDGKEGYGQRNVLLYKMDYGLVLHFAGRYKESIRQFEQAKRIYDNLYTISVSNKISTWLVNDVRADYRGEDFERVMINIFQALNFAAMGNIEEALVEARDVDLKLRLINSQYKPDQKNAYKEDAFARLFMGILYEASGTREDINNAFISYAKAVEIYEQDYSGNYSIDMPQVLKENVLSTAKWMGPDEFDKYRKKFKNASLVKQSEKLKKGEVYLVLYRGFSPIKHEVFIPIPLPGGIFTKLAFPHYDHRYYEPRAGSFKAVENNGKMFIAESELGESIEAIAIENLENRRARVIAKAALRITGKYFAEKVMIDRIEKRHGEDTAKWFRYLSSMYNISTERADLRSWQTLPAEIHLARLILKPGQYELFFNKESLLELEVHPGMKKFIILRTSLK